MKRFRRIVAVAGKQNAASAEQFGEKYLSSNTYTVTHSKILAGAARGPRNLEK
jgi:hypothetical protein